MSEYMQKRLCIVERCRARRGEEGLVRFIDAVAGGYAHRVVSLSELLLLRVCVRVYILKQGNAKRLHLAKLQYYQ